MMPVVMLKAGCQGGPGSQVWTPTLCLQVMVAGNQATGEFGGWGGHRPDGVSSSEGPGWANSRELAGVTPPMDRQCSWADVPCQCAAAT